jgi:F-type H+-transporting ATPase subunit gamma
MAKQLVDIMARIENVKQLDAVTTAMRGIAAARAQQSKAMLSGISAYTETISRAIGQALGFAPGAGAADLKRLSGRALILFCAEQGFVGALNDRILNAAGPEIAGTHLMIVGTRGAGVARERDIIANWTTAMASQIGAVPVVANHVADALYALIAGRTITRAEVLFARVDAEHAIEVARTTLFPIDLERFRQPQASMPPLTTLEPEVLLEGLAAEYIYAVLCEAAMHAFAAENQARMEAMSSATSNIDRMLSELKQRENQVRQEEVTAEIIELASGNRDPNRES